MSDVIDDAGVVLQFINSAKEIGPEPPRPLMRATAGADPFPVGALGDVLGDAARAIHDRIQAPLAICGQSVLATAALAAQAHADVELPIVGRIRPISVYLVTVAESGERKSACDDKASWPIRRREQNLRATHDADAFSYQNDHAAWERARDRALRDKGDRSAIKAKLDAIGPAPQPALEPLLTCPEPTYEGLCKLFAIGWPSLGIYSSEGGQFIGGHGMNDENRLRTACGLSGVWDGAGIRRVRSGDGVMVLPGRRLSLHLMVQPKVAEILFGDDLLLQQGLLSRVLVSAPDSAAGTRLWRDERAETDRDLKRYGARLLDMLEAPLPLVEGRRNELSPRKLELAPAARRCWLSYADYVECAVRPGGELDSINGLAAKLAENPARLAADLALVDDLDAGEISEAKMQAGIALADHYAAEALRLFGRARTPEGLQRADRLRKWLLNSWGEENISLPDIYRLSVSEIRTKAAAQKAVDILEDHGWLERRPAGTAVNGQQRRDVWRRRQITGYRKLVRMTGYTKFADARRGENERLQALRENAESGGPPAKVAKVAKPGAVPDAGRDAPTFAGFAGFAGGPPDSANPLSHCNCEVSAWWRDRFAERAAIREYDGAQSKAEAELDAWRELEALWITTLPS
jgi:Protein of unknown function (DUF3987)